MTGRFARKFIAYAGGLLALVEGGDSISIDAQSLLPHRNLDDQEIARRRAGPQQSQARYQRGVLGRFASNAARSSWSGT
jgi:dihydroxy-acid dehydratase